MYCTDDEPPPEALPPGVWPLLPLPLRPHRSPSPLLSRKTVIPPVPTLELPAKPTHNVRDLWSRLLPRVPSCDYRPELRHHLLLLSAEQKSSHVGQCFAWGSHIVYNSTQSNAVGLRYLYWGKVISYGPHSKSSYPQIVPGLSIDPWFHVTSQNPKTTLPIPFQTAPSLRPRTRHIHKTLLQT